MNIFIYEFKMRVRSVITWSVVLFLLILLFMSLFQSFAKDTALVLQLMKSFPKELLIAFGMANMDWSTILGFYGLVFVFCQVCLAVQAANYGFSLVSIEESEWTADFLLSKPVSRPHILTAKLLAAVSALAVTNAVVWIASLLWINVFNNGQPIPTKPFVLLLLSVGMLQLFFLTVGMIISLLVKRVRSVTPFSMGLVFGLYIFNAFSEMVGKESIEILSPFKQFTPNYIILNEAWDMPLALLCAGCIVASVVGSYVLYLRRNIASAV